MVVRNGTPRRLSSGRGIQSMCAWITSKSFARFAIASSSNSAGGVRVRALSAQTERARPDRVELSVRPRIAAREECDVVSELDQVVDQPCDHSLGPTVELRGDAFGQGASWAIRIGVAKQSDASEVGQRHGPWS